MSLAELDNPVWFSLNSVHQHLAIGGDLAKRYPSDVVPFSALKEYTDQAYKELAGIIDIGETVIVDGVSNLDSAQWEILRSVSTFELICTEPISVPEHDLAVQKLTAKDVPEMMALVELTKPGPFKIRTIELGSYFGIHQDNQLVAMVGSRIYTSNYREISAVCTHPDYRGKGYASLLTTLLAHQFQQDGITPFLQVSTTKFGAKRLYEKLGFEVQQEIEAAVMRRLAD
jgi:predicted GNAT family acetyltransferase